MLKRSNYVLLFALLMLAAIQTVHASPTLSINPGSRVIDPGTATSFAIGLTGGEANATYGLALSGLSSGASYLFSPPKISGTSGGSTLTFQGSVGTPLYCPGSYQFTVTATNTIAGSDNASVVGGLIVNEFSQGFVVQVSTDKTNYLVGDTVKISITVNRAGQGTLIISPPSGAPSSFHYNSTSATSFSRILTATSPPGMWTATFIGDDYCGGSDSAAVHFEVNATSVITGTITRTSASTATIMTSPNITNTTTSVIVVAETGTSTITGILTSGSTITQTAISTTNLPQSSTTITITVPHVEDASKEVGLAAVLIISALIVWIRLARRARPVEPITCSKCGFKNPLTAPSFCVNCGQPLKRKRSR